VPELQSHAVGHEMVVVLLPVVQVTCPGSPLAQSRFTAVQLSGLPGQVTVPESQVAVQVARVCDGGFADTGIQLCCAAQEPLAAGWLRIEARALLVSGMWLGVWAMPAIETKRRE